MMKKKKRWLLISGKFVQLSPTVFNSKVQLGAAFLAGEDSGTGEGWGSFSWTFSVIRSAVQRGGSVSALNKYTSVKQAK
jgi:heme oxygenase